MFRVHWLVVAQTFCTLAHGTRGPRTTLNFVVDVYAELLPLMDHIDKVGVWVCVFANTHGCKLALAKLLHC